MSHEKITRIQTLAARCGVPCDTLIYVPDFDAVPKDDSLNRVAGPPVGVDRDTWPRFDGMRALFEQSSMPEDWDGTDTRMEHVFTIDLRGVEGIGAPAGARAMMLFISNSAYNEAWEAGTSQTEVVFLDEGAVARGLCREPLPARSGPHTEKRFTLVPIRVPAGVFAASSDDAVLGELRTAIWQAPARIGGEPIWLQGEEGEDDDWGGDDEGDDGEVGEDEGADGEGGDDQAAAAQTKAAPIPGRVLGFGFMMQFDEAFADVNLGDCGVMYVMGHGAWFQCY